MDDRSGTNPKTIASRPTGQQCEERSAKPMWETPKMEDVSEQVMAQPYIRFT